ncbi:Kinetochore Sim4 complex subunit Fta4 [Penicillium cf. griseofulvum]|nr:Kinetochore Sim4 complex subunit Fta4 [Penicillium cf. griseofulvum]
MRELVEMVSSREFRSRADSALAPPAASVSSQHNTLGDCLLETCDSDQSSLNEFAIDLDSSDSDDTVPGLSAPAIIEGDTSPSPFQGFHAWASPSLHARVENHASWFDEDNGTPQSFTPDDPQLEELNRAFADADVSMNNTAMASNGTGPGNFSGYENNTGTMNMPNIPPRQTPSPSPSHSSVTTQINGGGMGAMSAAIPMNAGHQMDLHHLYEMVVELSDVLKNNRDVTKNIVANAEEIVKNGIVDSSGANGQQGENLTARIAELERALAKEKRVSADHKYHREENWKMIQEFETAVGVMVEQIRNYCQNNNMHYLAQKKHYNNLLQAERDAHLESRLDRDYWHAQTMKCAEMIRTAYRLKCEEDDVPTRVISGLQNEVRAYRFALGMEAEKPEEEYGWEYLKDIPGMD